MQSDPPWEWFENKSYRMWTQRILVTFGISWKLCLWGRLTQTMWPGLHQDFIARQSFAWEGSFCENHKTWKKFNVHLHPYINAVRIRRFYQAFFPHPISSLAGFGGIMWYMHPHLAFPGVPLSPKWLYWNPHEMCYQCTFLFSANYVYSYHKCSHCWWALQHLVCMCKAIGWMEIECPLKETVSTLALACV